MKVIKTPQARCRAAVARCDITPPVGIYHRMWGTGVARSRNRDPSAARGDIAVVGTTVSIDRRTADHRDSRSLHSGRSGTT